jgi:DNA repair protein RadC
VDKFLDQSRFAARSRLGQASGMEAPRTIVSPADALALFAGLAGERLEHLWGVCLGPDGSVLALRSGSPGSECSAPMSVTELLRDAVTCGAAALIVAHNHPGGDPAPSLQDVRATRKLAEGADALGIRLLDHIVMASGGWTSFRLMGLL